MPLIILIILATIFYSLFEIFISRTANEIDAYLSPSVFNAFGALITLVPYLIYKYAEKKNLISTSGKGMKYTLLAGAAIGLFSLLFNKIFEKGGNLDYVIPLIYGGAIVLSSLVGIFLFRESISALQTAGIVSIVIGIALIIFSRLQASAF